MEKQINCPICESRVMGYDGRGTLAIDGRCKNCNVLVVYNPRIDTVLTVDMPQRQTISGLRFY